MVAERRQLGEWVWARGEGITMEDQLLIEIKLVYRIRSTE